MLSGIQWDPKICGQFCNIDSQGFIWGGGGGGGGWGGAKGGNFLPLDILCGFKILNDLPVYGQLVTLTIKTIFF